MFAIAMPDYQISIDLKALLDQVDNWKIIQLIPDSGKYHHFHFANSLTTTTRNDTTVTSFDAQAVGGTPATSSSASCSTTPRSAWAAGPSAPSNAGTATHAGECVGEG